MSNAVTKSEVEAIEAFRARKEAEDEAARLASRSVEDIYIDRFNAIVDGERKPMHIMEVLAELAAFFHDDDPEFRSETSDPNHVQFNQKGMLANLCHQADWMLEREERRMHYLRTEAIKARRQHTAGEIDTLALEEAELSYGRSKIVNVPILTDFKAAVLAAHVAQFAEHWTRPVKRDDRATTATLEDRFQHSKTRSRL